MIPSIGFAGATHLVSRYANICGGGCAPAAAVRQTVNCKLAIYFSPKLCAECFRNCPVRAVEREILAILFEPERTLSHCRYVSSPAEW